MRRQYSSHNRVQGSQVVPQVNNHVYSETPSGSVNSSNTAFTLANTPVSGTLRVYQNGQRITLTTDYTLSGTTITFVTAPETGDILRADYEYA